MDVSSLKTVVALLHHYGLKSMYNSIYYAGKIAGRFVFPILLMKSSKRYISHPSYYPECRLKTKFRIFIEQLFYIMRTGEINKDYFLFGFDRVSKNDFGDYVPWLTFTHKRNTRNQLPGKPEYDPYNYICLLRDKFVFEAFCKGIGLKTPSNIAMINAGTLYLIKTGTFMSSDEIMGMELDAFCKREVSFGGGQSRDLIKLRITDGVIYLNEERSDHAILKKLLGNDRWIIQERIKNQDPEYARFHPDSINTIRIVTLRNDSDIDILCSFFRMGVHGRHADNWSSGGILVGVNIKSGTLEKWGLFKPGYGGKSDRHPDSKIVFEGYALPCWEEMVTFVKKAHRLFYGLHSIGWDVAVTTDGIMLIEGNDNWDTIDAQFYKGAKEDYKRFFL